MRAPRAGRRRRILAALAPAVIACACTLAWVPAASAAGAQPAEEVSPLPASDYAVSPACAPALPGRVACQALELVPLGSEARAHRHPLGARRRVRPSAEPSPAEGFYGLTPADLHGAYRLPASAPDTQTIALVDAYNDPAAEADLAEYSRVMGLPACTQANGCFAQVNQHGESSHLPFPSTLAELKSTRSAGGARAEEAEEASEWGLEISLDIETAHAVCESCHILLVEASAPYDEALLQAEGSAETLGADEISNSWAGSEEGESEAAERHGPFNHAGTVITASAGDSGYLDWDSPYPGAVEFPASSPHVIAVGGTRLGLTHGAWASETVWNGDGAGGGGCSTVFAAPGWQLETADWSAVGCGHKRAVADISADADPYTGVAVADSTSPECEYTYSGHVQHWCTLGGTSLASPVIAAVFALAGGSGGVSYPASTLYENVAEDRGALHDVSEGSNGACAQEFEERTGLSRCTTAHEGESCTEQAICVARAGYDGPSGLGTPDGLAAFEVAGASGESEIAPPGAEEGVGGEGSEEGSPEAPSSESGGGSGGGESGKSSGGESPAGGSSGGEAETPETEEGEEEEVQGGAHHETCKLSDLALSDSAAKLARHVGSARLSFNFRASAASTLEVSLQRRREVRGRTRWQGLARGRAVKIARGRDTRSLTLPRSLAPGTYRLTLKPRRGTSDSLVFVIP